MEVIVVTAEAYAEMHKALLADKKITAIKALRAAATPPPGEKSLGLREAKLAVERYCYDVLGNDKLRHAVVEGKRIVTTPVVKEIVCDFGTGPVKVDVEAMELRALSDLHVLGLEACGRMLELCEVIKAFSEGKRVGVIDDD